MIASTDRASAASASGREAPTVSTHGALPGAVIPAYWVTPDGLRPLLPAEVTTTIPAATARLAASVSGSVSYDSYTPVATERFTTRMFSSSLFATT